MKAACAKKALRSAHIGTMGYRDMMLYGTQFEGSYMCGQIGVEAEPYETLEMVQAVETLDPAKVAEGVVFARANWVFENECDDSVIETGVKYVLAILKKIEARLCDLISPGLCGRQVQDAYLHGRGQATLEALE